ncbi:MAG TPA: S1/P1 nuclease [Vicinamibacterales bacterium]|nr:S1/P1 nuclease [Vicinamibacterales bacterium]
MLMTNAQSVRRIVGLVLLWAILALGISTRVSAWGAVGHHIVARIAWAQMTPAARERATALLEGGMDAFVAAATWADEVRQERPETYNWHFVNIHVSEGKYDAARHCPASDRGDCVIAAIARLRTQVVDASRPASLRAEDLKFLIHFVGDLHQPLHSIDNKDRGGNDVRVEALRGEDGRATNLHAAWDTGMINLSPETEAARAERLLIDLASRPTSADLDTVKWAEGNHDIALKVVYRYPGFAPTGPPTNPVVLDEAYRKAAIEVIDRQLQLGGVRLAALLNSLLSK